MRSIPGIPLPDGSARTDLAGGGEVRWIERLQQRAPSAAGPSVATSGEAGSWINRLQQRAANDPR